MTYISFSSPQWAAWHRTLWSDGSFTACAALIQNWQHPLLAKPSNIRRPKWTGSSWLSSLQTPCEAPQRSVLLSSWSCPSTHQGLLQLWPVSRWLRWAEQEVRRRSIGFCDFSLTVIISLQFVQDLISAVVQILINRGRLDGWTPEKMADSSVGVKVLAEHLCSELKPSGEQTYLFFLVTLNIRLLTFCPALLLQIRVAVMFPVWRTGSLEPLRCLCTWRCWPTRASAYLWVVLPLPNSCPPAGRRPGIS